MLQQLDPATAAVRTHATVLALGFRLFYLLAGAYAAISIAVWSAQFSGWLPSPPLVQGPLWHAHEMLFGYTFAVITGFLFTAVKNWAQRPTPTGMPLAALGALWVAGRVLSFTPWRAWSALTDAVFALGVAIGIARPLVASANRRNYFFIALVLVIGAANLAFQAGISGWSEYSPQRALWLAADAVLFVIAVVAGRVVPMFTNNAVQGAGARRVQAVEYVALGSVIALALADLAGLFNWAGPIAAIAAAAHLVRLALWSPLKTLRTPLLWILHISYAWIVVHLALRAASAFGMVTPSLAMHALTVGAVGGMTLGMMTRSALGHSGRELKAGAAEVASYVLVQLAAITRVLVPLLVPSTYLASVSAAGVMWFTAFAVFTVAYWPILTRPRVDGRPG
jgi:uncharacterized protein involved in response to NO